MQDYVVKTLTLTNPILDKLYEVQPPPAPNLLDKLYKAYPPPAPNLLDKLYKACPPPASNLKNKWHNFTASTEDSILDIKEQLYIGEFI